MERNEEEQKRKERDLQWAELASLYHQMMFLIGQREMRPIKRLQSATLDPVSYWVRPYANREREREREKEQDCFEMLELGLEGFVRRRKM